MSDVGYLEHKQTKIKKSCECELWAQANDRGSWQICWTNSKKWININKNKDRKIVIKKNVVYGYASAENRPIMSDNT